MVAVQEAVFPLLSVTVKVDRLAPMSAQEKELGKRVRFPIPQVSLEKLFTSRGDKFPLPLAFKNKVRLLQFATGEIVSNTLTIETQVPVFPFKSVTVRIIELFPVAKQYRLAMFGVIETIPQKSLDALLIKVPVIFAAPPMLRKTVAFRQLATGDRKAHV